MKGTDGCRSLFVTVHRVRAVDMIGQQRQERIQGGCQGVGKRTSPREYPISTCGSKVRFLCFQATRNEGIVAARIARPVYGWLVFNNAVNGYLSFSGPGTSSKERKKAASSRRTPKSCQHFHGYEYTTIRMQLPRSALRRSEGRGALHQLTPFASPGACQAKAEKRKSSAPKRRSPF